MTQDYKIKAWDVGKDPFLDNNGNTWGTAVFEGVSEPVRWAVKDPRTVRVGDTVHGEIIHATSKSDKQYLRFKRSQPAEAPQNASQTYNPDGARQGMCYNNANLYVMAIPKEKPLTPREWAQAVQQYAQALYLQPELVKEIKELPEALAPVNPEDYGDWN